MPSSQPSVPQVRHAGPAHIRGKIRRIWRPRYLELWDNGLIRYYELPTEDSFDLSHNEVSVHHNSNNNNDSNNNSSSNNTDDELPLKYPKYTLAIYSARILDGTTLRDLHVGLPRGSFGFLFRGTRLVVHDNRAVLQSTPVARGSDFLHLHPPHHLLASCSGGGGGGGSGGGDRQSTAVGTITGWSSRTGAALGDYTASVMAATGTKGASEASEQRDFFCAVRTLEEAQMWVVALQWAADRTAQRDAAAVHQAANFVDQPITWRDDDDDDDDGVDEYYADADDNNIDDDDKDDIVTVDHPAARMDMDEENAKRVIKDIPTMAASSPSNSPINNVSVVSKVVQYRVVRLLGTWTFEIAYEIHVLLLKTTLSQTKTEERAPEPSREAEQWVILRIAADFETLIKDLCSELALNSDKNISAQAQQNVLLRPISRLGRWINYPTHAQLQSSLSIVDSILRSLVMDAVLVNTNAMKSFLGLFQPPPTNDRTWQSWWASRAPLPLPLRCLFQPHNVNAEHSNYSQGSSRVVETVPTTLSSDQYVRQWIQQKRHVRTTSLDVYAIGGGGLSVPAWSGKRTFVRCSTAAVSVLVVSSAPFVTKFCQNWMPRVSIRLDVLVLSYVGAVYLGHCFSPFYRHSRQQSTDSSSSSSPRVDSSSSISGDTRSKPMAIPRNESHHSIKNPTGEDNAMIDDDTDDEFVSTASLAEYDSDEYGSEANIKKSDNVVNKYKDSSGRLCSPLPHYPDNDGCSCWSQPDSNIFHVRGASYLKDRVKIPSQSAPLTCRGVDVWITDNPERHIARHPAVLGGKLGDEDTFLVNFLLPFGNFVAYFTIPPLHQFPKKLRSVWTKFLKGDQEYRDARLKLLPVVEDGPWIVRTAVGSGKSPALLGKVIPLQYFFRDSCARAKAVYEVDVILTASTIAKGILSVVKNHTKCVSIAFALIIEAATEEELPETVLCSFRVHSLHLEDCPLLPSLSLSTNSSLSSSPVNSDNVL